MTGRPITNISRRAEEMLTQAILSGRVKPKWLESDSVVLRQAATAKTTSWRDLDEYKPALHNPATPLRPGAEDALKLPSAHGTQAVYKRHHP